MQINLKDFSIVKISQRLIFFLKLIANDWGLKTAVQDSIQKKVIISGTTEILLKIIQHFKKLLCTCSTKGKIVRCQEAIQSFTGLESRDWYKRETKICIVKHWTEVQKQFLDTVEE